MLPISPTRRKEPSMLQAATSAVFVLEGLPTKVGSPAF